MVRAWAEYREAFISTFREFSKRGSVSKKGWIQPVGNLWTLNRRHATITIYSTSTVVVQATITFHDHGHGPYPITIFFPNAPVLLFHPSAFVR
jgi:hypothetical protein